MLPNEERHQRKCVVCSHPEREEIEEEFVHWRDVYHLAKQYDIADSRSIYRHARVFGLIEQRRENRRAILDRILENGPAVVSAQGVIQAIRAYSCLTPDNRWVEPARNMQYQVTTNHLTTDRLPKPAIEIQAADTADAPTSTKPAASDETVEEADEAKPAPEPAEAEHVTESAEVEHVTDLAEPETIHHAGTPPGPLPKWDGRFTSTHGNPGR